MSIVLRIIGIFWIFWTAKPCYWAVRALLESRNIHSLGVIHLLQFLALAGGIGLVLLREWGRWVLLVAIGGLLFLQAGPQVLDLEFTQPVIRVLIFCGVFLILLLLPQSRAVTKKP